MIMTFDLFGYGKYAYTFENRCREVPECSLLDGTVKIFLNTKGKNADEVREELIEFLNYVEDSTDEAAKEIKSERVKRIHNQVCKVKLNEESGVKYMQAWEEKYYEREEGKEEGRLMTLVNQVCRKLTKGMNAVDIADMLEEEGIHCKVFAPIRLLFSPHYNNRDHRKILVIDGHTAFNGGVNLADEYINQKKIEKAQLILVTDEMSVKNVAFALSFDDYSYFNRLFKKTTGLTPQEYRNSYH